MLGRHRNDVQFVSSAATVSPAWMGSKPDPINFLEYPEQGKKKGFYSLPFFFGPFFLPSHKGCCPHLAWRQCMFAEKQTHLSSYHPERRPLLSYAEQLVRKLARIQSVEQLNFGRTFQDLLEMKDQGEETEESIWKKMLDIALSLWSMRQEVLGDRQTKEVITPVYKTDQSISFWSDLHAIENIEKMLEDGLHKQHNGWSIVPNSHKSRYRRENKQLTNRWRKAVDPIKYLDHSGDEYATTKQLQELGFEEQEIELTPSLIANIPSIRATIHTIDDFMAVIDHKRKLKVWVGSYHHLTLSPHHWIHAQGKSTFIWDTQVVCLPSSKEFWIREHGNFSHTPLPSILDALSWNNDQVPLFSSEEQVMQYIHTLQGYGSVHPSVLLAKITSEIKGYIPAPKMDENVTTGTLPIQEFISVIQDLFTYELERCEQNPQFLVGSYERLQFMAGKVKHLVALNDPTGLDQLLKEYQMQYASLSSAQHPDSQFNFLNQKALQLNSKFRIQLDWSLFDCVAGTPMSLMNTDSLASLKMNIGAENFNLLQTLDNRSSGISSKEELEKFCKAFGKDASLFSTRGQCVMCHKNTFIWSSEHGGCNICPVCEVKDDMGLYGNLSDSSGSNRDPQENSSSPIDALTGGGAFAVNAFNISQYTTFILNQRAFMK